MSKQRETPSKQTDGDENSSSFDKMVKEKHSH